MELVLEAPSRVPPTVAQQVFVIGSGVAGGAAGLFLAKELTDVKDVPVPPVVVATLVSILFTFGAALYLAKNLRKAY
jgi:heterodisulfide reductase subunit A-like polyferredoxin